MLRNAADRQETMRIQFATVPGSDKVLLCISVVKADVCAWKATLEAIRAGLDVGAVIITDEAVHIGQDGAEPQDERCEDRLTDGEPVDLSRVYHVDYCSTCVRRLGDKWVASKDCNHA